MKRYEYKDVITGPRGIDDPTLLALGKRGWKMTGVIDATGAGYSNRYYFARELPEKLSVKAPPPEMIDVPEGWAIDPGLTSGHTGFLYPIRWDKDLGGWPSQNGLQANTYDQYYLLETLGLLAGSILAGK